MRTRVRFPPPPPKPPDKSTSYEGGFGAGVRPGSAVVDLLQLLAPEDLPNGFRICAHVPGVGVERLAAAMPRERSKRPLGQLARQLGQRRVTRAFLEADRHARFSAGRLPRPTERTR